MYEVWEGDLFLFYVDTPDEVDHYVEQGFNVRATDMS